MTKALFQPDLINALPTSIQKIRTVMAALRHPEQGCPWDLEQTFETIAPYSIEEAYEVRDAIQSGDMDAFREELGDLLLQVVYHCQLASEQGLFDLDDVAQTISDKMIRRHPHVFANAGSRTSQVQKGEWEKQKAAERKLKTTETKPSAMDDIVASLPALTKAEKIQGRAARVGFDWPNTDGVYDKIDEEIEEVKRANTFAESEEEVGDLLFTVVNLARKLTINPEESLRKANDKFETRFRQMELQAHNLSELDSEELETIWRQVKQNSL